jgi:hypothetical protein
MGFVVKPPALVSTSTKMRGDAVDDVGLPGRLPFGRTPCRNLHARTFPDGDDCALPGPPEGLAVDSNICDGRSEELNSGGMRAGEVSAGAGYGHFDETYGVGGQQQAGAVLICKRALAEKHKTLRCPALVCSDYSDVSALQSQIARRRCCRLVVDPPFLAAHHWENEAAIGMSGVQRLNVGSAGPSVVLVGQRSSRKVAFAWGDDGPTLTIIALTEVPTDGHRNSPPVWLRQDGRVSVDADGL